MGIDDHQVVAVGGGDDFQDALAAAQKLRLAQGKAGNQAGRDVPARIPQLQHGDVFIRRGLGGEAAVEFVAEQLRCAPAFHFIAGDDVRPATPAEAEQDLGEALILELADVGLAGEPVVVFFIDGPAGVILIIEEVLEVPQAEENVAGGRAALGCRAGAIGRSGRPRTQQVGDEQPYEQHQQHHHLRRRRQTLEGAHQIRPGSFIAAVKALFHRQGCRVMRRFGTAEGGTASSRPKVGSFPAGLLAQAF